MIVSSSKFALRVKDVRIKPHVRVGHAVTSISCIEQQSECSVTVALGLSHKRESANGNTLPTRILKLTGPRECLTQNRLCELDVPSREFNFAKKCLRPRKKCEPAFAFAQRYRSA